MSSGVVIDTNIILFATLGHDESKHHACANVFHQVVYDNDYRISLDTNNEILSEYESNISDKRSGPIQIFENLIQQEVYGTGSTDVFNFKIPIHESQVSELLNRGFHDNDIIYVRVAPNCETGSIVSTDLESFHDEEYKEWIEDNLEINVFTPEEAVDQLL